MKIFPDYVFLFFNQTFLLKIYMYQKHMHVYVCEKLKEKFKKTKNLPLLYAILFYTAFRNH